MLAWWTLLSCQILLCHFLLCFLSRCVCQHCLPSNCFLFGPCPLCLLCAVESIYQNRHQPSFSYDSASLCSTQGLNRSPNCLLFWLTSCCPMLLWMTRWSCSWTSPSWYSYSAIEYYKQPPLCLIYFGICEVCAVAILFPYIRACFPTRCHHFRAHCLFDWTWAVRLSLDVATNEPNSYWTCSHVLLCLNQPVAYSHCYYCSFVS